MTGKRKKLYFIKTQGTRDKKQSILFQVHGRYEAEESRFKVQVKVQVNKSYMSENLENRFLNFAIRVRNFCTKLKQDVINREYIKQLIRASASVGANYIEASDDLGKADEKMKIKISRREAKESVYWLKLILTDTVQDLEIEKELMIDEGNQIRKILSAILIKLS